MKSYQHRYCLAFYSTLFALLRVSLSTGIALSSIDAHVETHTRGSTHTQTATHRSIRSHLYVHFHLRNRVWFVHKHTHTHTVRYSDSSLKFLHFLPVFLSHTHIVCLANPLQSHKLLHKHSESHKQKVQGPDRSVDRQRQRRRHKNSNAEWHLITQPTYLPACLPTNLQGIYSTVSANLLLSLRYYAGAFL